MGFLNTELEKEGQHQNPFNAATLMSSHTHEIFGIGDQVSFSEQMRRHHSKYGMFFNKKHDRCGKVAQDRPKTCLIENDYHEMQTTFYVHANPVRAKMVNNAANYKWSTHKLYAFGKREAWMRNVVFPKWYMSLGRTPKDRQKKYRRLFDAYLRNIGLIKQDFLHAKFYGSPAWTEELRKVVSEWRESHDPSG